MVREVGGASNLPGITFSCYLLPGSKINLHLLKGEPYALPICPSIGLQGQRHKCTCLTLFSSLSSRFCLTIESGLDPSIWTCKSKGAG